MSDGDPLPALTRPVSAPPGYAPPVDKSGMASQMQGGSSPGPARGYPQAPRYPNRAAAAPRQRTVNGSRLRPGDLIAAGGSLLVLITLFLPWYTAHQSQATRTPSLADISRLGALASAICGGRAACLSNASTISISALHGGAGGWRILILILAIVTFAYLLVKVVLPDPSRLPHWQLVTGLTTLTGILTLIALLANPLNAFNGLGATAGIGIGAIIGLIAALAAVGGGVLLRAGAPSGGQTSATGPPTLTV
jgi:hypothetical protein